MDELICPVCGQANPPTEETCSNCGASLHAPIQPGQPPVKKHTSELEPILPDWLREARERGREAGGEDIGEMPKKDTGPFGGDLLAGLSAQSDDEAEVPDWLADITGAKAPKQEPHEPIGVQRVELGDFGEPEPIEPSAPQKEPQDDLQDWFRQVVGPPASEPETPAPEEAAPPAGEGPMMDWLEGLRSEAAAPGQEPAVEGDLPDWLAGQRPAEAAASSGDVPDWLKDMGGLEAAADLPAAGEGDLTDWSASESAQTPPAASITPADLPDWFNELREASGQPEEAEPATGQPAEAGGEAGSFEWLRGMDKAEEVAPGPESTPAFDETAIPASDFSAEVDWLKGLPHSRSEDEIATPALSEEPGWFTQASTEVPAVDSSQTLPIPPLDVELPDWLKEATPESLASEEIELPDWMKAEAPVEPAPAESAGPAEIPSGMDLPEWMTAGIPAEPIEADIPPQPRSGLLSKLPELEKPEARAEEEQEAEAAFPALPPADLPSGSMDSLFTAMPDWLTEATPAAETESPTSPLPPVGTSAGEVEEALTPATLPSWVQAMRPVEAAASGAAADEGTIETQGPLAGLSGLLTALPYIGPSSRPKTPAMKLDATNEQQNHGGLLEHILEAEVHPEPLPAASRLTAQRGLHLAIGLALFIALLAAVLGGTQILPLPLGWPPATAAAVQAVESIPPDAPVLVVFDYEPSLAGEMEAVAAPLLDHVIVRSHPALTLISTSPTGTALAERMFAGPLAELAYQNRLNLGYLPGGLGGVRSFVQDAAAAMPLAADSTPVTQGVLPYSAYAGIIIITDSVEGGRTWIEQAGPPFYNGGAFVVAASAQAGPMLQPYYQSGQINGLASGLFDAAVLEQNNAGRPGLARRYWDAYNLGLMLAVAMITIGALWNLVLGLRQRDMAEGG